jgi:hypothetical protein
MSAGNVITSNSGAGKIEVAIEKCLWKAADISQTPSSPLNLISANGAIQNNSCDPLLPGTRRSSNRDFYSGLIGMESNVSVHQDAKMSQPDQSRDPNWRRVFRQPRNDPLCPPESPDPGRPRCSLHRRPRSFSRRPFVAIRGCTCEFLRDFASHERSHLDDGISDIT